METRSTKCGKCEFRFSLFFRIYVTSNSNVTRQERKVVKVNSSMCLSYQRQPITPFCNIEHFMLVHARGISMKCNIAASNAK